MFRQAVCFVLLFISITAHSQAPPTPVAWFTFSNGKAINQAGNLQAKVQGASFVEDRFGNDKSAVYLHGNNSSYINLGTGNKLKPIKGSISLWLNIDLVMLKGKGWDYNPILLTKSHGGDDFYEGYFIGLNYNTNRLNVTTSRDQNNQITLNSSRTLSLRKWHHIVMCYDDDTLSLYLDNKLEAKLPKKFRSSFLEGDSIMIGNSANQKNERYLCGTLDDIRIYDQVLNPSQIDEIYHTPNPNRYRNYLSWAIRIGLLALLIAFIVWLTLFFYKRKLRDEQERNRLNTRLNELETKAARSQMNPHFMFNALNTLQGFILENDMDNAHLYLTKFSKLIRKILESGTSESIPLSEEIIILTNYIDIERMRFETSFEYNILNTVKNPEKISIPFMLIQPFVENAIWHGLSPKKGFRELHIDFNDLDDKRLLCKVTDNGVGRYHSAKQKDPLKKKSLAIEFIKQRLELIEKSSGVHCSIQIEDHTNAQGQSEGTSIKIIIPKFTQV